VTDAVNGHKVQSWLNYCPFYVDKYVALYVREGFDFRLLRGWARLESFGSFHADKEYALLKRLRIPSLQKRKW
jgi:hypothetical protein